MVTGDRTQLERLISNLLSNALKYTTAGGRVILRASTESNGWARLVVEDTGVGIPAENLPHIFDRFYRVRNAETNKIQGLGLGLSFVSWIVSAHGGKLEVSSKVGEGTCFTLTFPPMETSGQAAPEQAVTAEPGRA
jgi:signal transduction histidine kinase